MLHSQLHIIRGLNSDTVMESVHLLQTESLQDTENTRVQMNTVLLRFTIKHPAKTTLSHITTPLKIKTSLIQKCETHSVEDIIAALLLIHH